MSTLITIYGAGAIGGHLAARAARGGAQVSIIARGPHLAAIQAHGLDVQTPTEHLHTHPTATDDPATLGKQDAVIVTVKSPALPDIAAAIAPLLKPATLVVFVLNGIPWWYGQGAPTLPALAAALDSTPIAGGVVYSACEVASPGHIHVDNARNRLVLGTPDGAIPPALETLAATIRDDAMRVDVTPDIRTEIWAKLVMNLSTAPFAVLSTTAPKDYLVEPALLAAVNAAAEEALAIAAALGLHPNVNPGTQIRAAQSMTHKPSILQDLLLGRKMEIATILDAPLALARRAGVATPTLDLLSALARVRAREAGLYS